MLPEQGAKGQDSDGRGGLVIVFCDAIARFSARDFPGCGSNFSPHRQAFAIFVGIKKIG
jgi:hypothetical protein